MLLGYYTLNRLPGQSSGQQIFARRELACIVVGRRDSETDRQPTA